jgi:small-conductance mechanosensitive channel
VLVKISEKGFLISSSNGVDIGPLPAGAVGFALGFGAQRLVGDVLAGIFFLVDDTFRIG